MKLNKPLVWPIFLLLFSYFCSSCQISPASSFVNSATPAPDDWQEKIVTLPITWQNQPQTLSKDSTVYLLLEIYDQSAENRRFLATEVQAWLVQADFPLVVIDYPLSQRSKSFMTAALSQCLMSQAPERYPFYLSQTAKISGLYDDNVEMQALFREMNLKYDNRCVAKNMKQYQKLFENKNPLQIKRLPLLLYRGIFYPANATTPAAFQKFLSSEESKK